MIKLKQYTIFSLFIFFLTACGSGGGGSGQQSSSPTQGQAGSMARFALVGDYLYTMNESQMNIFDVKNASEPVSVSKVRLPWDVETLFPYKNYLYIGASSGMYIYDNSVPTQPTRLSTFTHAQSCDPVVVQDDIAYVTLNTGADCWNNRSNINRLEIVDVRRPDKPKLIKTLDMWEPTGLGIDGTTLFICDGDSGLKIFDINSTEDEHNNTLVHIDESVITMSEIDCYDVIAYNKHLVVSNGDDVRQFDYASFPMEELGKIK